eukprot:764561-Amphidinium_carterae.1
MVVDVLAPQTFEEIVNVPNTIPKEKVMNHMVEQILDVTVEFKAIRREMKNGMVFPWTSLSPTTCSSCPS